MTEAEVLALVDEFAPHLPAMVDEAPTMAPEDLCVCLVKASSLTPAFACWLVRHRPLSDRHTVCAQWLLVLVRLAHVSEILTTLAPAALPAERHVVLETLRAVRAPDRLQVFAFVNGRATTLSAPLQELRALSASAPRVPSRPLVH